MLRRAYAAVATSPLLSSLRVACDGGLGTAMDTVGVSMGLRARGRIPGPRDIANSCAPRHGGGKPGPNDETIDVTFITRYIKFSDYIYTQRGTNESWKIL